ncbi:MAG: apolipoprotein N-acyltransferase [Actinobacteria bacterium]|nr:MAG: apolipoprotein N-acyltransferase [Actinomycetota bacterium]RIK05161.1 MAG: apolipoprotein N-acyltransferase [Acidobacteriota bacterium]
MDSAVALLAGTLICFSLPPWGWWPLTFVGLGLWVALLRDAPPRTRFWRGWLVGVGWFAPSTLWMIAFTPPGWFLTVFAGFAVMTAVVSLSCPPSRWLWLALPGTLVLMEYVRWRAPFGGVPLSTLPMAQAGGPLLPTVRLAGSLFLTGIIAATGVAVAAAWERCWKVLGATALGMVVVFALAFLAPAGETVSAMETALVQGGGPQGTRATTTDFREVFERQLEASQLVQTPVQMVLWPENTVNLDVALEESTEHDELGALARELDTTLVVGVVESVGADEFTNRVVVYDASGEIVDSFDKVRRVPFGEYVPVRWLFEPLAGSALPPRDAIAGTEPAVLETPEGTMGVVVSWEVFFDRRAREAAREGALALLNPTNGASYWLTMVQTQQVASSRLRAVEIGRWVLQSSPTGFSAFVDADGEVLARTSISEQAVLEDEVELRRGTTWATAVGDWPVLILAAIALASAWVGHRRSAQRGIGPPGRAGRGLAVPDP